MLRRLDRLDPERSWYGAGRVSYAIGSDEAPCAGLTRIVGEQVGKLRESCADARDQPEAFVHGARVRAKRIRAALRLLRPALGREAYARENAWWRDTARGLSRIRDMTARSEALAAIAPEIEAGIDGAVLRRLRWQFDRERRDYEAVVAAEDPIGRFCGAVDARYFDVFNDLDACSHKQLAHGLGKTYRKARRAMADAYEGGTPDLFHEWRKQTKYHALQLRLVRHVFPAVEPRIEAARDLAELLGAVQDIEVLMAGLSDERNPSVIAALEGRRRAMLDGARVAGEALFALKPKDWARAIHKAGAAVETLA
jgi:CHAD domain-containing protein